MLAEARTPDLEGVSHTSLLHSGVTLYTPVCAPHPLEMKVPMRAQYNAQPTRLLIGVTVYNEQADELQASLTALLRNLRELQSVKAASHTLEWNEVMVLFIVDGADKLSDSAAEYLESLAGRNELLHNYKRDEANIPVEEGNEGRQLEAELEHETSEEAGVENSSQASGQETSTSASSTSGAGVLDMPCPTQVDQLEEVTAGGARFAKANGVGPGYNIKQVLKEHRDFRDSSGRPVSAQMFEWASWLRIPVNGNAEVDDVGSDPLEQLDSERQWAEQVGNRARRRSSVATSVQVTGASEATRATATARSTAATRSTAGTATSEHSTETAPARGPLSQPSRRGEQVDEDMPEFLASIPVQLGLIVKQHNGGKTAACGWLFWAASRVVQPKYVMMLDVGTVPVPCALSQLVRRMEESPDVGGMTGELSVRDKKIWRVLEMMQWIEYRMSQVIGRVTEDTFGFIAVLPGAFALYRFSAIEGEPLQAYFRQEETNEVANSAYLSNVYLAEDRMMTMRIISQHNARWKLKYEPKALAFTDVPCTLNELMRQRRRWTNGALAANWHAMCRFPQMMTSEQSFGRKILLTLQMIYILFSSIIVILSPATTYIASASTVNPFVYLILPHFMGIPLDDPQLDDIYPQVDMYFHIVASTLLGALILTGAWPGSFNRRIPIFAAMGVIWGVMFFCAMLIMVYAWTQGSLLSLEAGLTIVAFVGVILVASITSERKGSVFLGLPLYLLALPTFSVVIMTYSVLNCHDLSWGTKSATKLVEEDGGVHGHAQHSATVVTAESGQALDTSAADSSATTRVTQEVVDEGTVEVHMDLQAQSVPDGGNAAAQAEAEAEAGGRQRRVTFGSASSPDATRQVVNVSNGQGEHMTLSGVRVQNQPEDDAEMALDGQASPVIARMLPTSKDVPRLSVAQRKRRYKRFRNIAATLLMAGNIACVVVSWMGIAQRVLLPIGVAFVLYLLGFVFVGMVVFTVRRWMLSLYRRMARPPLAGRGETQKGNCVYKVDSYTGKLQSRARPRNFYGNDWIWAVLHNQLSAAQVRHRLGDHVRSTAVDKAELYRMRTPASKAKARYGQCPLPVADSYDMLALEYELQSGKILQQQSQPRASRRSSAGRGALLHSGIMSTTGITPMANQRSVANSRRRSSAGMLEQQAVRPPIAPPQVPAT